METNTEPPAVVIFADDFENHPHLALAETAAALRRSALLPTAAAAARAPLRDITHLFAPPGTQQQQQQRRRRVAGPRGGRGSGVGFTLRLL